MKLPDIEVFPKDEQKGWMVKVGTIKCPSCHKDLTIALHASATVTLRKPQRKRKKVIL